MDKKDVKETLRVLNEMWPVPMTSVQVRMYGEALAELESGPVEALLKDMMRSGDHEFRPSIAAILKPFQSVELEQASKDFQKVLEATRRYPPGMRDGYLSPRAAETVRRMGGWSVIGQWQQDARHHQLREFSKVWDDVSEADTAKRRGAIASGASPIVASLAGAKSTPAPTPKPGPRKVTESGLTAEFRKMLKGGE
jgi:hypothetical protein